uniref:Receptor ligand binding region domain-containing protein n=1 Tax=Biomphalaria glabrata TaxID=6526 RepID=A0A2C9KER8_BIOGL
MPVISWGPEYIGTTDKREPDNLQLNISPTLHHQAAAMLNVLRHYNWTDFSLVYTSDTGHDAFITAIRLLVQDLNTQSGRKGFKSIRKYLKICSNSLCYEIQKIGLLKISVCVQSV